MHLEYSHNTKSPPRLNKKLDGRFVTVSSHTLMKHIDSWYEKTEHRFFSVNVSEHYVKKLSAGYDKCYHMVREINIKRDLFINVSGILANCLACLRIMCYTCGNDGDRYNEQRKVTTASSQCKGFGNFY